MKAKIELTPVFKAVRRAAFAGAVSILVTATSLPAAPDLLSVRNPSVPLPTGGNDDSSAPGISANGRFVIFTSAANDLTPAGNGFRSLNVFVRDRVGATTKLVSLNLNGSGGGNGNSLLGQVSTNGRLAVFQSDASDLVLNDTNGVADIFIRDLVSGTTAFVSVSTNGGAANGSSRDPVMTPDGHYVAFVSRASNLVPGDTNGIPDVFVRDLVAGTNYLVSVGARLPLANPNWVMSTPLITPDGRYVAFFSLATNLAAGVPNNSQGEIYVRDLIANTTTWASTNAATIVSATLAIPAAPAYHPRISDDGRIVAFKAGSTSSTGAVAVLQFDLISGTTATISTNGMGSPTWMDDNFGPELTPDGRFAVYVVHEGDLSSGYSSVHRWDSQSSADILVSDSGSGVPTNTTSCLPLISTNGQYVVFISNATNLTAASVSNGFHIYRRDLQSATTLLLDGDTNGVGSSDETLTALSLSAEGQLIAFSAPDGNLVSLDSNHASDVFARDCSTGTLELVSQRSAAVAPQSGNARSSFAQAALSGDGQWLAFSSLADNLVLNDTNQTQDVFVRNLAAGTNSLVSRGFDGGPALGGASSSPVISTDGRYVAFISAATNLMNGTANFFGNIFRRELQTGTTVLISVGADGSSSGNNDSFAPQISSDGQCVAFVSAATNLAPGLTGGLNTYWRKANLGQTVGLKGANALPFDPSMSSNGRYLAYAYGVNSTTTRLQIRDTQLGTEVYTNTGAVTSAAIDPTGTRIAYRIANTLYVDDVSPRSNLFSFPTTAPVRNGSCWNDDGQWFTFVSSTNLHSGNDGTNKVYLLNLPTGTLSMLGVTGPAGGSAGALSDGPVLSASGRFVAYRSVLMNTAIADTTVPPNLFLLDRLTASNLVLTAGAQSAGLFPWLSRPVISDGGQTVAFESVDSTLVNGDLNRETDVFGSALDVGSALVDTDGDGIPDWWMIKYFGHPTGQADDLSLAQNDADGSGMSNLGDYLAGTSPLDPSSALRITPGVPGNSTLSLTWPAVVGRNYQVQYKTNLTDTVWKALPGNVQVSGGIGFYSAPASPTTGYYRVLVLR